MSYGSSMLAMIFSCSPQRVQRSISTTNTRFSHRAPLSAICRGGYGLVGSAPDTSGLAAPQPRCAGLWPIEGVDPSKSEGVQGAMLVSGSEILLREQRGSGFFLLGGSPEKGIALPEERRFVVYEADVPNPTPSDDLRRVNSRSGFCFLYKHSIQVGCHN